MVIMKKYFLEVRKEGRIEPAPFHSDRMYNSEIHDSHCLLAGDRWRIG
jgi:hypothetical protein